jgi:hypothetical protein
LGEAKRKKLIVGIDPGTTSAVAIMNLKGDLIELFSSKNMSSSDLIKKIASIGKPLIIASDVVPAPKKIEKVKRAFNASLYENAISVEEKISLTNDFHCKNEHERDALAATLYVFRCLKNKFEKIEKKTPEKIDADEVKELMVKGHSINSSIVKLMQKDEKKMRTPPEKHAPRREGNDGRFCEAIKQKDDQISRLKAFIDELKLEMEEKDEDMEHLANKIKRIRSEEGRIVRKSKEIQTRNGLIVRLKGEIKNERETNIKLKNRINKMMKMMELESSGKKIVKVINSFKKDEILKIEREYGIWKGDILFLFNSEGGSISTINPLIEKGVIAIIGDNMSEEEAFLERGMPVFSTEEIPIQMDADTGIAFVDRWRLDAEIERWYREKDERLLDVIIDEYRHNRM